MYQDSNWMSPCLHPFFIGAACFFFIAYNIFPFLLEIFLNYFPVIACTTILLGILLVNGEPNLPKKAKYYDKIYTSSSKKEEKLRTRIHVASRRPAKRFSVRTIVLGDRNHSTADKAVEQNEVNQVDATSVDPKISSDDANDNKDLIDEASIAVDKTVGQNEVNQVDATSLAPKISFDEANDNIDLIDETSIAVDKTVEQNEVNRVDDTSMDVDATFVDPKNSYDETNDNKGLIEKNSTTVDEAVEKSEVNQVDAIYVDATFVDPKNSYDETNDNKGLIEKNSTTVDEAVEKSEVNQVDAIYVDPKISYDEANDNKNLIEETSITVDAGVSETKSDHGYHSCSSSEWHDYLPSDATSDSESGEEERYDSSVPDDLHHLDSEVPQSDLASSDTSDCDSLSDYETALEGEEVEDDEEEEDEKDDTAKGAVAWTAEDQRILLEIKRTELERNRLLENVIAKRKARLSMERNLIDLDDNAGGVSKSHCRISSVTAPRRNPFDQPYDSDEPGSAPCLHLTKSNPFDLPCNQALNHREFSSAPQRDVLFRRHESFGIGASFCGELKQEWHSSWLKPCHNEEKNVPREANSAHMNNKSSETRDSKACSASKSELEGNGIGQTHQANERTRAVESKMSGRSSLSGSSNSCAERSVCGESTSSDRPEVDIRNAEKRNCGYLRRSTATKRSVSSDIDAIYEFDSFVAEKPPTYISDRGCLDFLKSRSPGRSASVGGDKEEIDPSANGFEWFAPPSLASVDADESKSREIADIKELDVIGHELYRVRKDFGGPVLRILSTSPGVRKKLLRSSMSSMGNESNEDS